ncbi:MAG: sigma-70 family RNA polymerase sigma factor [Paludibacter sp.]|jgi:RNA polymerase sigma-70 factor (ECF subfamily)|nr:sigma-70 family RNA polymerase sigma factor [Paludibacter sp.]
MESDAAITNEQQLIAGCKDGKAWAQKKLFELYAGTMLSICVRYVTDRETAKDVLQDGFVKLFTKIDTFSGTGSFAGWVRRIFVTTALEYLRQKDALKQSESLDDYSYSIENPDVTALEKIAADDLLKMITELPTGYRTVFNLYAIEGYSHLEIANLLNVSENTSRSQFMRARKLLQQKVRLLISDK